MAVLTGLSNFLSFIEENWTMIAAIATVAYAIAKKLIALIVNLTQSKDNTTEEQLEAIKSVIKETILKYTSDAEDEYCDLTDTGSIKRAQVIKQLYEDFPALSSVMDQESLISFIDEQIDSSLKSLRKILKTNTTTEEEET